MDSFHPDTHSGDESLLESFAPLSDIAIEGLSAGAGAVLGAGVKLASVPFVGKVKKFAGEAVYPVLEKTKPFHPDKVIDPDPKHQLSELYQGKRKGMKRTDSPHKKDLNTVAFDYVDIKADMEVISQGQARVSIRDGSEVYVNGRVYKHHEKEKFFPVRGDGLMNLTPGEFRAYGILNKFGDTGRAREVVQMEKIPETDFKRAIEIFKENRGD